MSSSSTVTYTSVYTNSEPGIVFWGADEELSDGGPEHPPSPDYVPGPEHPSLPVKPLLADASPTALSPGYVADSDLDEDSEEDPEEHHTDYHADGGDDDDEEPFEDEDDDEEEEEHLALADSSVVPVIRLRRARKTVRLEPPMSPSMEARIAIPSPQLPPLPSSLHLPPPVPTSLPLPSSPLPPLPAPLSIPPPVDRKEDIPKAELPPRKRLCLTAPTLRCQRAEEVGNGIRDLCVDPTEAVEEVSSLQGQLSAALGHIQALQARDQTHADDPEGAGSSA
ncbi:hypothetical protein Tco_0418580 [Tanacetum coccineum]